MTEKKFIVTGMTCSACSAHVEKSVRGLSGVEAVDVNLLKNSMTVKYNERSTRDEEIIKAVQDAGYGAEAAQKKQRAAGEKENPVDLAEEEQKRMKSRLIVSILFSAPAFLSRDGGICFPGRCPAFFSGMKTR